MDDLDWDDEELFDEGGDEPDDEWDDEEHAEHEENDPPDPDLENLKQLLDEGLEPRPRRKMNPNSLLNLKRGGIDHHDASRANRLARREEEIARRLVKMGEDPLDYYRTALTRNLIQEELNLEDLQKDLTKETIKANQQKIRAMIYSTTQTLLLLGDALKAQPKQNKVEDKKSLSALAQMFEEFRKSLPPDQANNAEKFRTQLDLMRAEYSRNLEQGDTK